MVQKTMVRRVWNVLADTVNRGAVANLARSVGITETTATLLVLRGVESEHEARQFLVPRLADLPDPSLLADMDAAVERTVDAIRSGERIVIYGDYDVDGITSTVLLVDFLRRLGSTPEYYIPNRLDEGYGLNAAALEEIASEGPALVLCVDTGSTAFEEAKLARKLGLDLIVLDHHRLRNELPEAVAVVNPARADCQYPYKELAAVGVVFNFLIALRARLADLGIVDKRSLDLREMLDLVALGTIADVVPLLGVNRILAKRGLERLSSAVRPGIIALKEVARIRERVNAFAAAFLLAPRLNAGGRLEHARLGVELLLATDLARARSLAQHLDDLNTQRQRTEERILKEALDMLSSSGLLSSLPVIVLASRNWHPGVIGIVASRLVERFAKPTFLIAVDEYGIGKASGRSVPGIDLHAALRQTSDLLLKFGGHELAAGFTIKEELVDEFRTEFARAVNDQADGFEPMRTVRIDLRLPPAMLNERTLSELERLEPFGAGNPSPVFSLEHALVERVDVVNGAHLKFQILHNGRRFIAIGFRLANRLNLQSGMRIDLAYTPHIDTFGGLRTLNLSVVDLIVK